MRPAFHIRSRQNDDFLIRVEQRFNAVRPAFHIRSGSNIGDFSISGVSMPCVRRFTFGERRTTMAVVNDLHSRFNAVRPAFHIRSLADQSVYTLGLYWRFNAVRPAFHIRRRG